MGADRPRRVRLIRQHRIRSAARTTARASDLQLGQQRQHHRGIPGLAGCRAMTSGATPAVDHGVHLRRQSAARPTEGVMSRFVPAARGFVVVRPCPPCHPTASRRPPVWRSRRADAPGSLRSRRTHANPPRCAARRRPAQSPTVCLTSVRGKPVMALPHRLSRAEPLRRITPRDPRPIPVHDPLDHLPMVPPRPRPTRRPRHQRLDPSPRRLAQLHSACHQRRMPRSHRTTWETRPSSRCPHRRPAAAHLRRLVVNRRLYRQQLKCTFLLFRRLTLAA